MRTHFEKVEEIQQARKLESERRQGLLRVLEGAGITPHASSNPEQIANLRGHYVSTRSPLKECNFACDHCRTVMVDISGGHTLMSCPPKREVACLGCGWTIYTTL